MDDNLLLEQIKRMLDARFAESEARLDARFAESEAKMETMMDQKLAPVRADIARLNHTLEPKVDATYELLSELKDKYARQAALEHKVYGDHEDRIGALETAYRINAGRED